MRRKLVVANWKMNLNITDAFKYVAALQFEIKTPPKNCEALICPPFTDLYVMDEALSNTGFALGAQNMHWEESGAFTGEISPVFLKEINVQYVILGHSERRRHFLETNQIINKKVAAALQHKITPIICIGESLDEHQDGKTFDVIDAQIKQILDGQVKNDFESIVWAYEPVWAIGTGKNATAQHAQEVALSMRNLLAKLTDAGIANNMRILCGGSVSQDNAHDFLKQGDIDGLLVGGASIDAKHFAEIIKKAEVS